MWDGGDWVVRHVVGDEIHCCHAMREDRRGNRGHPDHDAMTRGHLTRTDHDHGTWDPHAMPMDHGMMRDRAMPRGHGTPTVHGMLTVHDRGIPDHHAMPKDHGTDRDRGIRSHLAIHHVR